MFSTLALGRIAAIIQELIHLSLANLISLAMYHFREKEQKNPLIRKHTVLNKPVFESWSERAPSDYVTRARIVNQSLWVSRASLELSSTRPQGQEHELSSLKTGIYIKINALRQGVERIVTWPTKIHEHEIRRPRCRRRRPRGPLSA